MSQPVIDAYGNIKIHGRDELNLVFQFRTGDALEDLTGRTIVFEIDGVLRKTMQVVEGDPTARRLIVSEAEVRRIPQNGTEYVVRDETGSKFVRLDGRIVWRGFI